VQVAAEIELFTIFQLLAFKLLVGPAKEPAISGAIAGGDGAEGYVDPIIRNPSSNYTFTVGTGDFAGSGGTSGTAGGVGAAGSIIVYEYYQ
jgi:hypothetical protein